MSNEASTAPFNVGTIYLEARGESIIHFVASVVELYDVDGLTISPPSYDFENNIVNYTYNYGGTQPTEGDPIKAFELDVFLPTPSGGGEGLVVPLAVSVANSNNSDEKVTTGIKTNNPIIIYDENFTEVNSLENSDPVDNELRWLVAMDPVSQLDNSTVDNYFIFVIVKTDSGNLRELGYEANGDDLACTYLNDPSNPVNTIPSSAVAFSATDEGEFSSISLNYDGMTETVGISYTDPEPTYFNFTAYTP